MWETKKSLFAFTTANSNPAEMFQALDNLINQSSLQLEIELSFSCCEELAGYFEDKVSCIWMEHIVSFSKGQYLEVTAMESSLIAFSLV